MRELAGEVEGAGEFGRVVFCCHAVGILRLAFRGVLDKRGDRRLDLACFWRLQLITSSAVNGRDFVLRSDWPARFGSAAAGWAGGRRRIGR